MYAKGLCRMSFLYPEIMLQSRIYIRLLEHSFVKINLFG